MIAFLCPPSLNPDKQTAPAFLVGAEVASREFVKASARLCPPGTLGLFMPEPNVGATAQELRRLAQNEGGGYSSARVWGAYSLPDVLRDVPFTALHNPLTPRLEQLSYVRSQFAPRPFPITCLIHGFSHQSLLWDYFARLLLTPTLPCDSVVCTSNAARDAFANNLGQVAEGLRASGMDLSDKNLRLDVIPLGVDVDLFRPRDKADCRRLLGLPQHKTLLLYFGRMDHVAKADLNPLLLAFQTLAAKHGDDVVLVLAGATFDQEIGNVQQSAHRLGVADKVLVRPNPSVIEGPLYYGAADTGVILSDTLQESFGLAPVEAMASGLPVVVSDWSGYKETVHGETGFRVTTRWAECDEDISLFAPLTLWLEDHLRLGQSVALDVGELTGYLETLIRSPDLRARMGQAAREHAVQNFGWERVIGRYQELWHELAEIARALPPQEPTAAQLLQRPLYHRNFGHFATHTLDGSERLELTERGRHACQHADALLVYPEMRAGGALNAELLLTLLNFVRTTGFLKHRASVAEACDKGAAPRGSAAPPPAVVRRHLLWLLKYDLLRTCS